MKKENYPTLVELMRQIYFIDWEDEDKMIDEMLPKFNEYFLDRWDEAIDACDLTVEIDEGALYALMKNGVWGDFKQLSKVIASNPSAWLKVGREGE